MFFFGKVLFKHFSVPLAKIKDRPAMCVYSAVNGMWQ